MMEQVRLFAVCPMENWLGSSLYQIQGWTTFRESYSRALKQRPLVSYSLHALPNVWLRKGRAAGSEQKARPEWIDMCVSEEQRYVDLEWNHLLNQWQKVSSAFIRYSTIKKPIGWNT